MRNARARSEAGPAAGIRKLGEQWRDELAPQQYSVLPRAAPSGHSPASTSITMTTASSAARAAGASCSARMPSSIRARAGRASPGRPSPGLSGCGPITASSCAGPRSSAAAAAAISAMSSATGRPRRATATASTPALWPSGPRRRPRARATVSPPDPGTHAAGPLQHRVTAAPGERSLPGAASGDSASGTPQRPRCRPRGRPAARPPRDQGRIYYRDYGTSQPGQSIAGRRQ